MHCNFICGLSDVIIKTFSQSVNDVTVNVFHRSVRRSFINAKFSLLFAHDAMAIYTVAVAIYCEFNTKEREDLFY